MRISLALRAARACAAATLIFSLGLSASSARMGGAGGAHFARPPFGGGHFPRFASHGFNGRFEAGRFGFNRFGLDRFDRFGFSRFNRFGFSRFGGDQFAIGGWGWGGGGWGGWGWDGWDSAPVSTGAYEPIIVREGAPVIINIAADRGPGDEGNASCGGSVIHKLMYDSNGKYVGERQTPQC